MAILYRFIDFSPHTLPRPRVCKDIQNIHTWLDSDNPTRLTIDVSLIKNQLKANFNQG